VDIATSVLNWFMGIINTIMGWGSSFFGTVLPGGSATTEKKDQFVKYGIIIVALFFAAQIFRVNIGGKGKK